MEDYRDSVLAMANHFVPSLSELPSEEGTVWRVADRRTKTKGRDQDSFPEATNMLWAAVLRRARFQAGFAWLITPSGDCGRNYH